MASAPNELLTGLLKEVSRSFYITLRLLPATIRPQISLAYLLARTTDTVTDTGIVSLERRLELLGQLRRRITNQTTEPLDFGELVQSQGSPAERVLLERCEASIRFLRSLDEPDQIRIAEVLITIISGQELDLKRFAASVPVRRNEPRSPAVIALQTAAELDDYTYRVAGCVGEFWTRMCRAHVFPGARLDDAYMTAQGIRFGKGLQLVNILRDLPVDLRNGRCYLPVEELQGAGLTPNDLLDAVSGGKLRPIYQHHLDAAEAHLAAGWDYTHLIPRSEFRLRVACALPILIGIRTAHRLRAENVLTAAAPIKITRAEVRQLMVQLVACYPFPRRWRALFPTSQRVP